MPLGEWGEGAEVWVDASTARGGARGDDDDHYDDHDKDGDKNDDYDRDDEDDVDDEDDNNDGNDDDDNDCLRSQKKRRPKSWDRKTHVASGRLRGVPQVEEMA